MNKLMRREFACEADARKESERWLDEHPFHKIVDLHIVTRYNRAGKKRGRPKKGEDMVTIYQILARLEIDEAIVEKARQKLGRFILASNDTEIDPDTLLGYYKGQQSVERGFRFLKDKQFRVAEVYLERRKDRSPGNDNGSVLVGLFICRMDDPKRTQANRPIHS